MMAAIFPIKSDTIELMFTKGKLVLITLAVIGLVSFLTISPSLFSSQTPAYKPGLSPEADAAVSKSIKLLKEQKLKGEDLTNGPCLTNDLLPGWVADIVHNPRQTVDNLTEYQCQAYREGRAQHFVEIDLNGTIVRVK